MPPTEAPTHLQNYADSPTTLRFHSNGVTFAMGTILGNVYIYDLRKIDSPVDNVKSQKNQTDSHVNAITGKWNAKATEYRSSGVTPVPVTHLCFQEAPQKNTPSSPKRPSARNSSVDAQTYLQEEKAPENALNAVGTPVNDGRDSVKLQNTRIIEDANLSTENPGVSTNGTNFLGEVKSIEELHLSPDRKIPDSALINDTVFNSTRTTSASSSSFCETRETHHLDLPNELQVANVSMPLSSAPSSRGSSKLDQIDASLERLMKSIPLSPPAKKVTQGVRIIESTKQADDNGSQAPKSFLPTARDSDDILLNKIVLRQLIEDVTFDLREELSQSIRNLHIDLLRQFQNKSDEIAEAIQQQKKDHDHSSEREPKAAQ
mmetsp:Transcript_27380/g.39215  ORF Transcript_27380/g.39215 Transcript_27380/m.39215 type:complete len:375 (+) Transcript_27380:293-1417(+)